MLDAGENDFGKLQHASSVTNHIKEAASLMGSVGLSARFVPLRKCNPEKGKVHTDGLQSYEMN